MGQVQAVLGDGTTAGRLMATGPLDTLMRQIRSLVGGPAPSGTTDGQLLERFALRQEEAAFEALVQRYGALVLGVCRRVLDDPNDVADAFQATFLVLVRKANTLNRSRPLLNWLYTVAYHAALKAARKRRHESLAAALTMPSPDDQAWHELRPLLDAEVSRLPARYRAPILACYFEGKTHEEAAEQLGWPIGTVKGRLARARELLRQRLTRRGVGLTAVALGTLLAERAAPAAVPPAFQVQTVLAAQLLLTGKAGIAPQVISIVDGVMQAMFMHKLRIVALGALAATILLVGVGWMVYQGSAQQQKAGPAPQAIELPKDGKTLVLVLDYQGGFRPARQDDGQPEVPPLTIRADGTMVLAHTFGLGKHLEYRLSAEELQALLRLILVDNQFFEYDAKKVAAALQGGGAPLVADDMTTVLRIKTAAKEHEVSQYALKATAEGNKNIKALAQLHAIEVRLQRLMHEARAGGKTALDGIVKVANEHLKKQLPEAAALTAADLQDAFVKADGEKQVNFYRLGQGPGAFVLVKLTLPAKGEPKVEVYGKVK